MTDWVEQQHERVKQEEAAEDQKGGPGSGHYGHAGRPGQRGGSLPGSVAVSVRTGRTAAERQIEAAGGGGGKPAKVSVEEIGEWTCGDLPKDLTKLTQEQHKDVIKFLAKKPLKELRRWYARYIAISSVCFAL